MEKNPPTKQIQPRHPTRVHRYLRAALSTDVLQVSQRCQRHQGCRSFLLTDNQTHFNISVLIKLAATQIHVTALKFE